VLPGAIRFAIPPYVSIRIMRELMGGRMYPLTLEGLDRAMRELVR